MPPFFTEPERNMAKKDENLKRLKELSELLGREPDMSGSAADIAQRVAELEEELGGVDGTDNQASVLTGQENNGEAVPPERMIQNTDELVRVEARTTLHIDALHATQDKPVKLVLPETVFRVPAGMATSLVKDDLVKMQ